MMSGFTTEATFGCLGATYDQAGNCFKSAHFGNGLFPVLGEISQQRANHRLAQLVTRAGRPSGRWRLRIVVDPGVGYFKLALGPEGM